MITIQLLVEMVSLGPAFGLRDVAADLILLVRTEYYN